jgi:prepilin-type processing-associated H-X9-DG protein
MLARRQTQGFTVIEMFAVIVVISILVGILLPAIQHSRESARRTSCANNFAQVGLAIHGYHSAFGHFPIQLSGTDGSAVPGQDNDRRLSYLVGILPFIDQGTTWASISRPLVVSERDAPWLFSGSSGSQGMSSDSQAGKYRVKRWNAGGPEPFAESYPPWAFEPPPFRCPSDPGVSSQWGRTNYAACLGDAVLTSDSGPYREVNGSLIWDAQRHQQTEAAMRGVFVPRMVTRFDDVTDGRANTIMLGEIATDLGDRHIRTKPVPAASENELRDHPRWGRDSEYFDDRRPEYWQTTGAYSRTKLHGNRFWGRGLRWADGMPLYTSFNTILSPNREIVLCEDRDDCWGILPPSSYHNGGVNVCFVDGSIQFLSDSIEAGDDSQPTVYLGSVHVPGSPSPYGLWGALGTRGGGELKW